MEKFLNNLDCQLMENSYDILKFECYKNANESKILVIDKRSFLWDENKIKFFIPVLIDFYKKGYYQRTCNQGQSK